MKKILLITAMFMAMNTWSADYKICTIKADYNVYAVMESCATDLLNDGYIPAGGIYFSDKYDRYFQAFYKID